MKRERHAGHGACHNGGAGASPASSGAREAEPPRPDGVRQPFRRQWKGDAMDERLDSVERGPPRVFAWLVHLLTSTGAIWALLALAEILDRDWSMALLWFL